MLVFNVCQKSYVTLRIDSKVGAEPGAGRPGQAADQRHPAPPGRHIVKVPFGTIGDEHGRGEGLHGLRARRGRSTRTAEVEGKIANKVINRPVLPVGRTFVKGVDVLDGHLVRQSTDVKIQGRHLGLEVTRTYSSSARGEDGVMGAGWGWNYPPR